MSSWNGSTRGRATSTAAWRKLRAQILRDHRGICHLCSKPGANEVDHLVPVSRGGTDDPANLRPVHTTCHRQKTNRESQQSRGVGALRRRPVEKHPGLIDPDDAA